MAKSLIDPREGANEVKNRSPTRGSPGYYQEMNEEQLRSRLRGLRGGSREWEIVRNLLDERLATRKKQVNQRVAVAAVLAAVVAIIAAIVIGRQAR